MAKSPICSVENCGKPNHQMGWCSMHYSRWYKHKDLNADGAREPSKCSVEGCNMPHRARGWCGLHLQRWKKRGDVGSDAFTPRGSVIEFFRKVVLPCAQKDCLIWPYTRNNQGYGQISGKHRLVHRLACIEVHGPAPSPKHEVAHECGNGSLGCCNPRHLKWKTKVENQADRLRHGTHNRGTKCGSAKLSEDDVRQIRMLEGCLSQENIAAAFGVTRGCIRSINQRKTWFWLE